MKRRFLILLLAFFYFILFAGCEALVSEDYAINAVEKQGYSNVRIREKYIIIPEFYGCSNDDVAAFEALAINSLGKEVGIIICAGWPFKGVTVRTN